MSPASHAVGRLRKLHALLLGRMRGANASRGSQRHASTDTASPVVLEPLETRLLLSGTSVSYEIDFVRKVWNITNLTDQVITQTLNSSYSGIPYSKWIDAISAGTKIGDQLANNDFSGAASTAYSYGAGLARNYALESVGLGGVGAVVELAAWPIEYSLNSIVQYFNDVNLQQQAALYFQARENGNDATIIKTTSQQAIQTGQATDLPNQDLSLVNVTGNGWLFGLVNNRELGLLQPIGGVTPAKFYDYEEQQYIVYEAIQDQGELSSDSETIKEQFYAAATPGAPVITGQPQNQTINAGDTATFTVQATGSGNLQYQWLDLNGNPIQGATSASYTTGQAGYYSVQVSNGVGDPVASRIATLTIVSGPPVAQPTPSITAVTPSILPGVALPQSQPITITGSGFTPQSTLTRPIGR